MYTKGEAKSLCWSQGMPHEASDRIFLHGVFMDKSKSTFNILSAKKGSQDRHGFAYDLAVEELEKIPQAESENLEMKGEWMQFYLDEGPHPKIEVSLYDRKAQFKKARRFSLPDGTYLHNFMISENYLILNLQPVYLDALSFVLGQAGFTESLHWENNAPSLFMLIRRDLEKRPLCLETDSLFFSKSIHCVEKDGRVFCYFEKEEKNEIAGPTHLVRIDPSKKHIYQRALYSEAVFTG